jgi:DNA end-binding protein Ku
VSLHSAVKPNAVAFHQLDRRDQAPIRYKRVNEETGNEVDWKDIVKGYEVEKGRFVIVDDEDFARVAVRSNQQIDIKDFVPADEILPVYFDTPYMLSPSGRSTKAYGLFREALRKKGLAAIGTFVLRTREHICAVFPVGDTLVLDIMRFEDELRDPKRLRTRTRSEASRDKTFSARELEMAEQLIDNMRSEWDPSRYHDTYKDALVELLEKKAKTGTLPPAPRVKAPRGDVVDLMALLKKSIAEKGTKESGTTRRRKRAA